MNGSYAGIKYFFRAGLTNRQPPDSLSSTSKPLQKSFWISRQCTCGLDQSFLIPRHARGIALGISLTARRRLARGGAMDSTGGRAKPAVGGRLGSVCRLLGGSGRPTNRECRAA